MPPSTGGAIPGAGVDDGSAEGGGTGGGTAGADVPGGGAGTGTSGAGGGAGGAGAKGFRAAEPGGGTDPGAPSPGRIGGAGTTPLPGVCAPPGRGLHTPPYGATCSGPSRPGLKKSSRSATGAVLHPADRSIKSTALRFMSAP